MSLVSQTTAHHEIEGPSDRAFGLTVGAILIAIAIVRILISGELGIFATVLVLIGIPLCLAGQFAPGTLRLLNVLWARLGDVLFNIVNPAVMILIYATTFIPIGIAMRLGGKDSLSRRMDRDTPSYWVDASKPIELSNSMKNQF